MSNENRSRSVESAPRGAGVGTVIGIIFITLKLLGVAPVASWPWVWVLAPFWIGIAILIAFVALAFVVGFFVQLFK